MLKAYQCVNCGLTVTSFRGTAPTCQRCQSGPIFQRLIYSDPLKPTENRETVAPGGSYGNRNQLFKVPEA